MPTPLFEPSAALDIYNDFRVILSETSGRTQAALVRESGGGPSIVDPVDIAITEGDLRDALDAIHPADQQGPSRRGPQTVIDPIKDVGARLFNSLFRGTLGHAYSEALSIAESTGKRLRVAIRVEDDSHRLSDLPWEFLFDPIRNDFLALSRRSILIREVSARPMLERAPSRSPIKVLVIGAPDPVGEMKTSHDADILAEIAKERALLVVTRLDRASRDDVIDALSKNQFSIIHFAGTGLDYESGNAMSHQILSLGTVSPDRPMLSEILGFDELRRPLSGQHELQLVFLNAHHTHRIAQQLATVIPAVVGIRDLVSVDFCLSFMQAFYSSISRGASVEDAMTTARQRSDSANPSGREWTMTLLYSHVIKPLYLVRLERMKHGPSTGDDKNIPRDPELRRTWQKLTQQRAIDQTNLSSLEEQRKSLLEIEGVRGVVHELLNLQMSEIRQRLRRLDEELTELQQRDHS